MVTDTTEKHRLCLPEPILVIDTREQVPWLTGDRYASANRLQKGDTGECPTHGISWVCDTLPEGDYQIKGLSKFAVVERKSLQDFVSSISQGRDRFFRELEALKGYSHPLLIIEADWADMKEHNYRSNMLPQCVLGTVTKIGLEYINVFVCGKREYAEAECVSWLSQAWELYHDEIYGGRHYIKRGKSCSPARSD